MTLTKESWGRLKNDPDFQEFLQFLRAQRALETDRLTSGGTLRHGLDTAESTAKSVGVIRGLDIAITFQPE